MSIDDLGSAVGLLFTIQKDSTILTIPGILPMLDLFSRVLYGLARKKFVTVCVGFDGSAAPFWFGSTLHGTTRDALKTRQALLEKALSAKNIFLPLVPPGHQEVVSREIMSIAVGQIPVDQNTPAWKAARQSCVALFQVMTTLGVSSYYPWRIVDTLTLDQEIVFNRIREEIADQIVSGVSQVSPVADISTRLDFSAIKASVERSDKPLGLAAVYGHCAETYPFIFLLNRKYLSFFFFFLSFFTSSPIPLGPEQVVEPRLHSASETQTRRTNMKGCPGHRLHSGVDPFTSVMVQAQCVAKVSATPSPRV